MSATPAPPGPWRVCAYFDMDGTVLARSTIAMYVSQLERQGLVRTGDELRLLTWSLLYRLGRLRAEQAFGWMAERLAGREERELFEEGERWYAESFASHIYEEAQLLMAEHTAQGHRLALLTASSPYIALPLARQLGIATGDVLCSRFCVEDGLLTGKLVEPLCFGQGKVLHAREHAARHGFDLSRSFFYTDSVSDLAMLEEVGRPRVVNPDRLLRRKAKRSGWPVLSFCRTRESSQRRERSFLLNWLP